jgi:hypothetical protein
LPRYCGLGRTISSGADAEAAWGDVVRAVDDKTRVAAREWRRLVDLRQVMTAEQAMTLLAAVVASVRKHVEPLGAGGRQALRGISADLHALLHARAAAKAGGK